MKEDVASATGNPSSVLYCQSKSLYLTFPIVHTSVCSVSSANSKFKKIIS